MNQKSIILTLDWSNLAFRSLYMSNGFGKTGNFDTDEEINSFVCKMAQDIAYILRIFVPSKIIFAADETHSWRKDVLDTYKINRVKSDSYNWDNIFGAIDGFRDHLEKLGYVFASTAHCEADDIMALNKELVLEDDSFRDTDLILVSADADIRQLISFRPDTEQYVIVYNEIGRGPGGFRHLYCNDDIYAWYTKDDETKNDIFFSGYNPDKEYIKNVLGANPKIKFEATDPENILMSKIFCGDDGDAVPAFYDWYNNKGKKVRITNTKFVKILNELDIKNIDELHIKESSLKDAIEKAIKREVNDIDVSERLVRQEKLVELKSDFFPDSIRQYKADLKCRILQQKYIPTFSIKMQDLVKGTKWGETVDRKAKASDVFSTLDKNLDKYMAENNLEKLF